MTDDRKGFESGGWENEIQSKVEGKNENESEFCLGIVSLRYILKWRLPGRHWRLRTELRPEILISIFFLLWR